MRRRQFTSLVVAVLSANVFSPALLAGVPSKKAVYRGGTLAEPKTSTKGSVVTTDPEALVFRYRGGELRIRYESVNSIEYGQKAGRRLGMAIAFSPIFLLSRKRRHYLTVSFVNAEGAQQAAVFELGKKIVRSVLASLEARTGRKIQYQDEEARKANRR